MTKDFVAYGTDVPDRVERISFNIASYLVPEVDENQEPTGNWVVTGQLNATAEVVDTDGNHIQTYQSTAAKLIDLGLMTQTHIDQLTTFMTNFRANVEGMVLPAP